MAGMQMRSDDHAIPFVHADIVINLTHGGCRYMATIMATGKIGLHDLDVILGRGRHLQPRMRSDAGTRASELDGGAISSAQPGRPQALPTRSLAALRPTRAVASVRRSTLRERF